MRLDACLRSAAAIGPAAPTCHIGEEARRSSSGGEGRQGLQSRASHRLEFRNDGYENVADRLLPRSADRPVSLVRAPAGICGQQVCQKHDGKSSIHGMQELDAEL